MKNINYIIVLMSFVLASCSPSIVEKEVVITANDGVFISEDTPITLSNVSHGILETLSKGEATEKSITLDLSGPCILSIEEGRKISYLYVEPGDQIELKRYKTDDDSGFLSAAKEDSKPNQYLREFDKLLRASDTESPMMSFASLEPDSFQISLVNKLAPLEAFTDQLNIGFSGKEEFVNSSKNRLDYIAGMIKIPYPRMYDYYNKEKPALPGDFYSSIERLNLNDQTLDFAEGRDFVKMYSDQGIDFEGYPNLSDYFEALFDNADAKYTHDLVRDYVKLSKLQDQINFGGGLDGLDDRINSFREGLQNAFLTDQLSMTVDSWSSLRKGAVAPDFKGTTRDGLEVSLSDLKGKSVYIDVWATWCGPCIREIPSLKELEKTLHGENIEFVSISVDEAKNKDKWLAFIEDKELGGRQLLADGAFSSDISTNYNIKGIPRFILVDAQGYLVSANAPRPSDESTEALLKTTL